MKRPALARGSQKLSRLGRDRNPMNKPATFAAAVLCSAASMNAAEIRFNRDIRPIFSENCFACHGPDQNARQVDLRLDRREVAVARGAIAPGDPAASKLVARIRNENEILRMPPSYSGKSLSERQKELLVAWVEQGAEYERHWAYIPPDRPDAPPGAGGIDFLVNQLLAERDLSPVAATDRRTLIRRMSFDLTGLPPTPQEVEDFESDRRPDAVERLVDRLLSSEHYGERMAVHWLDLVRYADTVGFHGDMAVSVYPYRDYVIRAFNENKPFDTFTREQLGGDLIPGASLEQRVASAYNRLGRMTNEGGSQAKEYLAKYAADRARTVSTVWLGSTMGCAECHDHKFDPFLARDFYSMQAFFADVEEEGVFAGYGDWGAKMLVPSNESRERLAEIDARIAELREDGKGTLDATPERVAKFAGDLRSAIGRWSVLEPAAVRSDCSHPDIIDCDKFELVQADAGVVFPAYKGEERPLTIAQVFEAELAAGRVATVLIEMLPHQDCEDFFLGEVQIRLLRLGQDPRLVSVSAVIPDYPDPSAKLQRLIDSNHHTGWTGNPSEDGIRRAVLVLETPIDARAGDRLQVTTIHDQIFGLHGLAYRQRLSVSDVGMSAFEFPLDDNAAKALVAGDEGRDSLRQMVLSRTGGNRHWREIRDLERLRKSILDHAAETLTTKSIEPRTIRVLPRGNWMDDSGEAVEPQAPSFLRQIEGDGSRRSRLDLADWIADRSNPLTARVFVNRLWKLFFGTGVSKVLDDLGSQGEPPVNPDLLDWLAVEFMDSGWDVKHIVRTMLLSETYRRSSEPTEELAAADPDNRLHGRQTAARLDAEFIRDNALFVSGLLNAEIGGPSSKPYQPAGHYKELNFPKREYRSDSGPAQYRRGLYTHWQRTFLHPSMKAFDAPSREECTADRPQSNTPLQSLVLLNDPSYVEAAKAFAARILEAGLASDGERVDFAFRLAFSRGATEPEREIVLALADGQRARYEAEPRKAQDLLGVGLYAAPTQLAPSELAAWTAVSRAILNKHELVMKY